MVWYSLLPPYLTVVETWIIRIAIVSAIVNMSPWLVAILIDLVLYIFRQFWYWVPIWGGRAQGRNRPRAPSLKDARRRTLSLAGIIGSGSPGTIRDEASKRRHERNSSEKSIDAAVEENPAATGEDMGSGTVS